MDEEEVEERVQNLRKTAETTKGAENPGREGHDILSNFREALANDDGKEFWMVNLMKYREFADYADGRESSISGREADDAYSPLDSLARVGARPVFFGDVDGAERYIKHLGRDLSLLAVEEGRDKTDCENLHLLFLQQTHRENAVESAAEESDGT